jgi:hypothetical protein
VDCRGLGKYFARTGSQNMFGKGPSGPSRGPGIVAGLCWGVTLTCGTKYVVEVD